MGVSAFCQYFIFLAIYNSINNNIINHVYWNKIIILDTPFVSQRAQNVRNCDNNVRLTFIF